jgi:hypothetical protein
LEQSCLSHFATTPIPLGHLVDSSNSDVLGEGTQTSAITTRNACTLLWDIAHQKNLKNKLDEEIH